MSFSIRNIANGSVTVAAPDDGGNVDPSASVVAPGEIVAAHRTESNKAINGGTARWEQGVLRLDGVRGQRPVFEFEISNTHSHIVNATETQNEWAGEWATKYPSDDALTVQFERFDNYDRSTNGIIQFWNDDPFGTDPIFVTEKPRVSKTAYYTTLKEDIFNRSYVDAPPSGGVDGKAHKIGEQPAVSASSVARLSRDVPAMELLAGKVEESSRNPDKLVIIASGQHPWEYQNKWAFLGFLDFITSEDTTAQTYRDNFVTVFYPHINPQGEWAGLWRGPAVDPFLDTNRDWDSNATLDTVIAHKSAIDTDIADLGLGNPACILDMHQSMGSGTEDGFFFSNAKQIESDYISEVQSVGEPNMEESADSDTSSPNLKDYSSRELNATISLTAERTWHSKTLGDETAAGEHYAIALANIAGQL